MGESEQSGAGRLSEEQYRASATNARLEVWEIYRSCCGNLAGFRSRISSVLCELSSGLHTADLKLSIRIHSAGKTWRVSVHFVTAS